MNEDDMPDIPGTVVFDGHQARKGYAINALCGSLVEPENRQAFLEDGSTYMRSFALSDEQVEALEQRDWSRLLELGGNIYFLAKLAGIDGLNMQDVGAVMSGMTSEEFVEMMRNGGRTSHD